MYDAAPDCARSDLSFEAESARLSALRTATQPSSKSTGKSETPIRRTLLAEQPVRTEAVCTKLRLSFNKGISRTMPGTDAKVASLTSAHRTMQSLQNSLLEAMSGSIRSDRTELRFSSS